MGWFKDNFGFLYQDYDDNQDAQQDANDSVSFTASPTGSTTVGGSPTSTGSDPYKQYKTNQKKDKAEADWQALLKGMGDAMSDYRTDTEGAIKEYGEAGMNNADWSQSNLARNQAEMAALGGSSGYGGAAAAGQAQAALGGNQLRNQVSKDQASMKMDMFKSLAAQKKAMIDMQYDKAKTEGNYEFMRELQAAKAKLELALEMDLENPETIAQINAQLDTDFTT